MEKPPCPHCGVPDYITKYSFESYWCRNCQKKFEEEDVSKVQVMDKQKVKSEE